MANARTVRAPRSEQQVGEVGWATIGRRSQIAVEPSRVNVAGANIVMPRQIQMRQAWLCFTRVQNRQLARDAVCP
jgi:hypothetical protein